MLEDAEIIRQSGKVNLEYADTALNKARETRSNQLEDDRASRSSRRSSRTLSSRASSGSVRTKALAEAAVARKQAEYDRLMAEKEHERRQHEAEENRLREQRCAQHDRDMAILAANKLTAIADAKLAAIERSLEESEDGSCDLTGRGASETATHRTQQWVNDQEITEQVQENTPAGVVLEEASPTLMNLPNAEKSLDRNTSPPIKAPVTWSDTPWGPCASAVNVSCQQSSKHLGDMKYIEEIIATNKQLTSSLVRQSLPKCHPDTFRGDATLFHPWKSAFKAMIHDADIPPDQAINYLRQYTSGEAQKLVDSYRKRQNRYPSTLLQELWSELEKRFGNTAVITNSLLKKLNGTSKFNEKEREKLQTFADVCADVDTQLQFLPGLACFNYPNVIKPIVEKLPFFLQSKWEKQVAEYAERNHDAYPGFHDFAVLMQRQATLKNHPNIITGGASMVKEARNRAAATSRSTLRAEAKVFVSKAKPLPEDAADKPSTESHCLFHKVKGHNLADCKAFERKPLATKTEWIMKAGLCFRCLSSNHKASACTTIVACEKCGSGLHNSLLHRQEKKSVNEDNGEELRTACTKVCRTRSGGLSCSKILLLDVSQEEQPEHVHRVYAIVDDQSNASLISPSLVNDLGVNSPREKFLLSTCSLEKEVKYGRRITGLVVRSMQGTEAKLPTLVECDTIPCDKNEIPTPQITREFPHLKSIAEQIPPLDPNVKIEILVGRDAPELLKVRDFRNGPKGAPWAQKLTLGWTVSGQVCLDRVGGPVHISTHRTVVDTSPQSWPHPDGENPQSIITQDDSSCHMMVPYPNHFLIKEEYAGGEQIAPDVFHTTAEDNEVSLSQDDHRFLEIMNRNAHKNERGNWEMPLPFRSSNITMPNNRSQAERRLNSLLHSFKRKPQFERNYFTFMGKILARGHATQVPSKELTVVTEIKEGTKTSTERRGKVWYLPHFGIYHPRKPDQIRVVFDSSAEFQGVSLNKELLSGPDQMNSLIGVLVRFRKELVALMCDHSFYVYPEHRNFLRFLWYKDNNAAEEIVEYRMLVHLFGNASSPAIATYGMRRTAEEGDERFGSAAKQFVYNDFYVDDGLTSQPTHNEIVDLLKNTQAMVATAGLKLHKAISNSVSVMEAIPAEDRGKNVRDLDLRSHSLPTQRSLGVHWDLEEDAFTFRVVLPEKAYTRRGVLSIINSVFDPLGLAAPVILKGKLLLRQLVMMGKKGSDTPLGWDDPLPERLACQWESWKNALVDLEKIRVPRCYHPRDFGDVVRSEVHSYSDASKDGIGVVTYLRQFNASGETNVAFLFGQAKMTPSKPTTTPCLELCAAVLSSQVVKKLLKELNLPIDEVVFYTDSKVTLGYIQNDSKRFYVYVANRVQIIRNVSVPSQWRYVDTTKNLKDSKWLCGPDLLNNPSLNEEPLEMVPLNPQDPEVRNEVVSRATGVDAIQGFGSERFDRFSNLKSLRRAIANLIVKIREFKLTCAGHAPSNPRISYGDAKKKPLKHGEPRRLPRSPSVAEIKQAEFVIIRTVQSECFATEIDSWRLMRGPPDAKDQSRARYKKSALKTSKLHRLDPFVDEEGVLRVGGRLRRSNFDFPEKHPVLLPKGHHISYLVARYQHEKVHHQGRQITHGAVHAAGYWIIGCHKMVSKVIYSCVTCAKLRAPVLEQHMANLPSDRLDTPPPFTNVGCDVFGPWIIHTRGLKGGSINSKRWGLVFTCLNSRAVHIEVLESMDSSAFICALRRFFSIRGPAARIRCDRGSNFIGAKSELELALKEMSEGSIKAYLTEQGCEWSFNPPHASHFGGVWERQIGTIRRVLDATLLELGKPQLSHELLVTLLAEVSAIVNARPIASIPSDIDDPQPLSPAMLLTLKSRPLLLPPGNFTRLDLYARRHWRRSQFLADQFWVRWRREYLQSLQRRPKWNEHRRNLTAGDVVLIRDKEAHRNDWLLGKVTEAIPSDDGQVRKVNVFVCREGVRRNYLRPISQLVLIVQSSEEPKGSQQ